MKTHKAGSKSGGVGAVPEMELENLAEHSSINHSEELNSDSRLPVTALGVKNRRAFRGMCLSPFWTRVTVTTQYLQAFCEFGP